MTINTQSFQDTSFTVMEVGDSEATWIVGSMYSGTWLPEFESKLCHMLLGDPEQVA